MGTGLFGLRERLIRAAQGPQKADLAAAARMRSWSRRPGSDVPSHVGPALPLIAEAKQPSVHFCCDCWRLGDLKAFVVARGSLQALVSNAPWEPGDWWASTSPKTAWAPQSTTARAPVALCAQSHVADNHHTSSEHLPGKH